MKKLNKLTEEQKKQIPTHVQKWIAKGLSTEPANFETFERSVKECYKFAGLNPNVPIVRVSNPFVGAFASMIANHILQNKKFVNRAVDGAVDGAVHDAVRGAVHGAVDGAVSSAVDGAVDGAVRGAVHDAVLVAVIGAVAGAVGSAVGSAVDGAVRGAVEDVVSGAVEDSVHNAVNVAVNDDIDGAVRGAVNDAVSGAVEDAVSGAVNEAVYDAVYDAVIGAVDAAVNGAVIGAVDNAIEDAVDDVVNNAVRGAVDGDVIGAVNGDVNVAVSGAVDGGVYRDIDNIVSVAVSNAVEDAVYGAVDRAVYGAVDNAVDRAVRGAVSGAVHDAVKEAVSDLKNMSWHSWMGGSFWAGWQSYIDYYYSVCHLDLGEDINARAKAYMETQMAAGHWWPNSNFIMVCDRPKEIKLDDNGRLHNEENMAISWRDGIGLYFYHGQHVPGWIITNPEKITIKHIQDEKNMEIQRCMIEKYGVSRYLMDISAKIIDMDCLNLIGSAPRALMRDDKGNQWLVASDGSTKRIYHIAVDSNVKTCKEAHESVCGFDESIITVEA